MCIFFDQCVSLVNSKSSTPPYCSLPCCGSMPALTLQSKYSYCLGRKHTQTCPHLNLPLRGGMCVSDEGDRPKGLE